MYACMYVWIHVCMSVYMYVCVCMYMYVCTYICMCAYMHVCVFVYVHACMCAYIRVCMYLLLTGQINQMYIFVCTLYSRFNKYNPKMSIMCYVIRGCSWVLKGTVAC